MTASIAQWLSQHSNSTLQDLTLGLARAFNLTLIRASELTLEYLGIDPHEYALAATPCESYARYEDE